MKMRIFLALILFIMLAISVSASHIFVNGDSLAEGDSEAFKTDNGIYVVKLLAVSDSQNKAKFSVNDEASDTLRIGESYEFKDGSVLIVREVLVQESGNDRAEYYFYGSGNDPIPVDINVDRFDEEECNFDSECQENETQKKCCFDCGCEPLHKCEDNKCIRKEGCTSDGECNDENPCTVDSCSNAKCSSTRKEGCVQKDRCVQTGTITEIDNIQAYCFDNYWASQKEKDKSCINDYECLSGECKENKCYERSYKGLVNTILIIFIIILVVFFVIKLKIIKKIRRYLFWKR